MKGINRITFLGIAVLRGFFEELTIRFRQISLACRLIQSASVSPLVSRDAGLCRLPLKPGASAFSLARFRMPSLLIFVIAHFIPPNR
jgi:hypothetical protein